jgi:hypothetical protein
MVSLAQRNLIRGKRLGLPAGPDVAKMMKMKPLSNSELGLPDPGNPGWAGKAPLWFYILREGGGPPRRWPARPAGRQARRRSHRRHPQL